MSACDPETELAAIHRLEFYKKQKNWKLGSTRHDKKCPEKQHKKEVEKKPNLNTTCSCKKREKEVSDLLNVAFVEDKSEDIQTHSQLSQEWLEPVNIWPPESDSENNCGAPNTNQNISGEFLKHVENCPARDDSGGTTPGRKNAMERVKELLKLHGYEEELNALRMMKETNGRCPDCYGCTGYDEEFPMRSGVQLSAGHVASEVRDAEADASDEVDGDCPEDLANSWTQPSIRPGPPSEFEPATEDSFDMAVDSFGEFFRGADAAPHSSEADLSLSSSLDIPDLSCTLLSRMSSRELVCVTEEYTRVLRMLIMEIDHRQRLREGGGDEPTHDSSLYLPPSPSRGRGRMPRPELWW